MEGLIFRILWYLLETGCWCIPSGGDNGCFSRKILFLGGRGGEGGECNHHSANA